MRRLQRHDRTPQPLLPATLAFAAAAVLAALIRLANLWLNGRLAAAVGSDLSCEAYRRTPTDQEADWRGFPLSRPGHQPGGGVVPLIPCSA